MRLGKHYQTMKKENKDRQNFIQHLKAYVVVNAFLLLLCLVLNINFGWIMGLTIGWGIGVLTHYLNASKNFDKENQIVEEEQYKSLLKDSSMGEFNIDDHLSLRELKKEFEEGDVV